MMDPPKSKRRKILSTVRDVDEGQGIGDEQVIVRSVEYDDSKQVFAHITVSNHARGAHLERLLRGARGAKLVKRTKKCGLCLGSAP